jgi:GTP-binding protein LepA
MLRIGMAMDPSHIRNFCIIAHIDHGKSTLADRLLELTGTIEAREMREQVLDTMDLERERGITIKAQAVRMTYRARDGETYEFNLIDTPGHVDFTYEVSRSLAACEGAVLVVDAAQGVEAQTLANAYMAIEHDLELIPVVNKIDLPAADVEGTLLQIREIVGLSTDHALRVSAKTGEGVADLLEAVVRHIPPPKEAPGESHLRALIFDSTFDPFRGVIIYVRVREGTLRPGDRVMLMARGDVYEVDEVGYFAPRMKKVESLGAGEVGYVIAAIKDIHAVTVGDTLTHARGGAIHLLPGYKPIRPVVFAGFYPVDTEEYERLAEAVEKLRLNDAAFFYEPDTSEALGFGFRCGFLGLLHMEIVQQRLDREFGVNILTTTPSVIYRVYPTNGEMLEIDNPSKLPNVGTIDRIEEPIVTATMITPSAFLGNVMQLCQEKRGVQKSLSFVGEKRALVVYELPLNEIIVDYYDRLKSLTQGYASFDYEFKGYQESDIVKLDILLNREPVDALSMMVHRDHAQARGRSVTERLKEAIPRQLFAVAIQAAIGGRIIARETIKALRKDVTAKCYGGDITRKRKLLEKQKAGKKRMKQIGKVEIPQEAFLAVLKSS